MKPRVLLLAAAFAAASLSCARAADAGSAAPWVDDLALINQTQADVADHGVLAVEKHLAELEQALAGAKHSIELAGSQTPTAYVVTDGAAETMVALTAASSLNKTAKNVAAVEDPYPIIAFYLGSYYDETGKPADALRVLDLGLTLSSMPDLGMGEHRPLLMIERGAALMALHRWQDALANDDEGLKMSGLDAGFQARFQRGRGYSLTELDRLDEAEAAYDESLKLEPDNALAKHELGYIAGLKAGKPRAAPGTLNSVQPPPASDGGAKP